MDTHNNTDGYITLTCFNNIAGLGGLLKQHVIWEHFITETLCTKTQLQYETVLYFIQTELTSYVLK